MDTTPSCHSDPPQHSYGTRIRQNISIKPSARLRNSPDPIPLQRKPKLNTKAESTPPSGFNYPLFPPQHVILHPDDATSKVFLAIGRALLSVDNRAMTIKDLAEMAVNFGLVCQNLSAASQAITTYIRTHLHRCEVQQDLPLLLRHTLSGTTSDDDLLPALHSRSGGAHCSASVENRTTNFRRGTMVWYLSRATGAPCPFARAGIRLCEYTENGKVGQIASSKEKVKDKERPRRLEHHQLCGQKRKRPLRGCVAKASGSGSESENDVDKPPPKVKLTLRLKPLLAKSTSSTPDTRRIIDLSRDTDSEDSEDDDYMSIDSSDEDSQSPEKKNEEEPFSLPPYPRRSITIPCYTPSLDGPYPCFPSPSPTLHNYQYRRSPSVPYSIGSPPPESEAEDDDFHISMTRHTTIPDIDFDWDADIDSEGDGETNWESPGPRSPSAPVMQPGTEVTVKEEPRDVQGMLDAWDDFDSCIADGKVAGAAATVLDVDSTSGVKIETPDLWDWDSTLPSANWTVPSYDDTLCIKQEDFDIDSLIPLSVPGPSSPLSPISSLSSQFSNFSYSESPSPLRDPQASHPVDRDEDSSRPQRLHAAMRPRAKTVPALSPFLHDPILTAGTTFSVPASRPALSVSASKPPSPEPNSLPGSAAQTLASLIQSMSMNSPTSGVAPSSLVLPPTAFLSQETRSPSSPDTVVVHTCQPCNPAISATQIEDISVYQMMLGPYMLLRRIDTDFVNLSPIAAYAGATHTALNILPNATVIAKGSPKVCGTWVPLAVAQAYVKDHPPPGRVLDVFLSDILFKRFPTALQDFHLSNAPGRLLNQFGRHFGSTIRAIQGTGEGMVNAMPIQQVATQQQYAWMPVSSAYSPSPVVDDEQEEQDKETPLSATEQELFHELCVIPEWEKDGEEEKEIRAMDVDEGSAAEPVVPPAAPPAKNSPTPLSASPPERPNPPLRRSKRVADAIAAQTQPRTRTRRRGSRNSIS